MPPGARATLLSPDELPGDGHRCLTFWYNMNGQHTGELAVLSLFKDGSDDVMWSMTGGEDRECFFCKIYLL